MNTMNKEFGKKVRAGALASVIALTPVAAGVTIGATALTLGGCEQATSPSTTTGGNEYDKDGYDKNGYDKNGYDKNGYDKNGYDKSGYDKNGYDRDGYNANGFDRDGYDQSGYDVSGYDKNGYDRDGYDQNGYDRDGNQKGNGQGNDPENDIPAFNFHPQTLDIDYTFTANGTPLYDFQPYTNNTAGNSRQGQVRAKLVEWVKQMYAQSDNLADGYGAVKAEYPQLSQIDGVISAEQSILNGIGNTSETQTYYGAINTHMNAVSAAIFGNGNAARYGFDNLYHAYTAGQYYQQKVRGDKSDLLNAFNDAMTAAGITPTGNVSGDLAQIRARMLTAINAAMGADGITNDTNRGRLDELNGNLINQMGDNSQFMAVFDDIKELGYDTKMWTNNWTMNDEINAGGNPYLTEAKPTNDKLGHPIEFDPRMLLDNKSRDIMV